MTFASKCTVSANYWSGAIGGLIAGAKVMASIAIDDITLTGTKIGGIIGYYAGSTSTLVNCIGKVTLPASGANIGVIVGYLTGGTVSGISTGPINELDGSPVNTCANNTA